MKDERMEELIRECRPVRKEYRPAWRKEYVDEMRDVSPAYEASQCPEPPPDEDDGPHDPPRHFRSIRPRVERTGYPDRTGVDNWGSFGGADEW